MDIKKLRQKSSQPRKKDLQRIIMSSDKVDKNLLIQKEMEEENQGLNKVAGEKISQPGKEQQKKTGRKNDQDILVKTDQLGVVT